MIDFIAGQMQAFEPGSMFIEPLEFIEVGSTLVVPYRFGGRASHSGIAVEFSFVHVANAASWEDGQGGRLRDEAASAGRSRDRGSNLAAVRDQCRVRRRGLGKGGDVKLHVDGEQVAEGRVEATVPMLFSGDETCDAGGDSATPVSDDYGPRDSKFTGEVGWIQIDIDETAKDTDHLIGPEERLRIAMARQ